MESQIRWAVAIENAAAAQTSSARPGSVQRGGLLPLVPLPLNAPEESRRDSAMGGSGGGGGGGGGSGGGGGGGGGGGAAGGAAGGRTRAESTAMKSKHPDAAMLSKGGFHTIKSGDTKSRGDGSSHLLAPSTPLGRHRKKSMDLGDFDRELDRAFSGGDKGLRRTLRVMNRGKCEHEAEIVTMHGKNVEKDDQTIHFLMESIGTSKGVIVVFLFCVFCFVENLERTVCVCIFVFLYSHELT